MLTKTIAQTRTDLADLLNRVMYAHERVIVTRRGKPVAAFVPVENLETLQKIEELLDLDLLRRRLAEVEEKDTLTREELVKAIGL